MSKLSKTLSVVKGGTTYKIPFYTTQSEANQYGDCGTVKVDGTTAYYPLGVGSSADTGSGCKSGMTCKKSNQTLYFLTKGNGELPSYNLVLSATSNQTITLKYKNRNYKDTGYESEVTVTSTSSAQTFSVRKGTTWTASIVGASGYNPGTLSASSGTVTAATTVSAGAATVAIIVLTDKKYKMSNVYSSTYQTMTTVPDILDSSNVTNMSTMFNGCTSLTTVPQMNTDSVTNMSYMFNGCTSLTTVPQMNTDSVTNMSYMFKGCTSLTTVPQMNTNSVTNTSSMFDGCTSLTTVPQMNTGNVTNMISMFKGCSSLPTTFPWIIDCSSISDGSKMQNMFVGSSVTSVTLANVDSSIRYNVTSKKLKGDNTLTINFV